MKREIQGKIKKNDAKNKNVHGEKNKVQGKNNLTIKDKKSGNFTKAQNQVKLPLLVKYNKRKSSGK